MKKLSLIVSVVLMASSMAFSQNAAVMGSAGARSAATNQVQKFSRIGNALKNSTPTPAAVTYVDSCDGDNSLTGLAARGYTTIFNGTGVVGVQDIWYQGQTAVFNAFNGPDTGYIASNYSSVASGDIDNWLITPAIATVAVGDIFSFYSQSNPGSTFPDSIAVMYSPTGAITANDPSWVLLDNFKVNVLGVWQQSAYTMVTAGTNATFAIRYKVIDGGPNGANSDYIGIDMIQVTTPTSGGPVNDECAGAIDLQSGIGQPLGTITVFGPYDNTAATVSPLDPSAGFECFGEPDGAGAAPTLDNTLWFSFVGDGGKYFIETSDTTVVSNYIDDGDTQIAIYEGTCTNLIPVTCNEDGPSAGAGGNPPYPAGLTLNTTAGTTYYVIVDGFNFNGALSNGEYNIEISQLPTVACTDPSVTLGTYSANKTFVCDGDSVQFDISGVITPTTGAISGLGWVISSADISNSADPLNDPSIVAGYAVQNPAPSTSFRRYINDGALIGTGVPYGTYFWTPIIFGNATIAVAPGTFMTQIALDPTCQITGNSIQVDVLAPGDPLCAIGLADVNQNGFGISNVFPVPVVDQLNFNLLSPDKSEVKVSVKDNLGKEVISESVNVSAGSRKFTYNVSGLNSGVYFISVTSGESVSVSKFMKQ